MKPVLAADGRLIRLRESEYQELLSKARTNISHQLTLRKKKFNRKYPNRVELNEGELVYVKKHQLSSKDKGIAAKLAPLFRGPFVVMENL